MQAASGPVADCGAIDAHLGGLGGIAAAHALDGQERTALVCLGATQGLRQACGGYLPAPEQTILDRLFEGALAPLNQDERQDAIAEGHNRPLAEIIADALGSEGAEVAAAD